MSSSPGAKPSSRQLEKTVLRFVVECLTTMNDIHLACLMIVGASIGRSCVKQ